MSKLSYGKLRTLRVDGLKSLQALYTLYIMAYHIICTHTQYATLLLPEDTGA